MERVTGIGGFFFRSKDPTALARWYEETLGVTMTPRDYDAPAWRQEAGTTVFEPFKQDTTYFGDLRLQWMINFRVRDLDKMVAQLRAKALRRISIRKRIPMGASPSSTIRRAIPSSSGSLGVKIRDELGVYGTPSLTTLALNASAWVRMLLSSEASLRARF